MVAADCHTGSGSYTLAVECDSNILAVEWDSYIPAVECDSHMLRVQYESYIPTVEHGYTLAVEYFNYMWLAVESDSYIY